MFYALAWRLTDNWRTVFGLRGDYYRFDVNAGELQNAGKDSDFLASPKGSMIYTIADESEVYVSSGYG